MMSNKEIIERKIECIVKMLRELKETDVDLIYRLTAKLI